MRLNEDERLDDLQFKNLKIIQNRNRYCFSADAVLLSYFLQVGAKEKLLDIGTGSGIIAILAAAKYNPAKIYGVEIQKDQAEMAARSVELNGLSEKIEIINDSIQSVAAKGYLSGMDCICCNPPYKEIHSGETSANSSIAASRHELSLSLDELMESAEKILKFKGKFFMIHRADRIAEIIFQMKSRGIEPKEIRLVAPKENAAFHLVLIKGVKGGKPGVIWHKPLYIADRNGTETEEIKIIYNRK